MGSHLGDSYSSRLSRGYVRSSSSQFHAIHGKDRHDSYVMSGDYFWGCEWCSPDRWQSPSLVDGSECRVTLHFTIWKRERKAISLEKIILIKLFSLLSPVFPDHFFDYIKYSTKSPSWFATKTEEPDGKVGRKKVDRVEEILIGERVRCDDREESADPWEEPCLGVLGFWMVIEFGKYRDSTHHFDKSICRDQRDIDLSLSDPQCLEERWTMVRYHPKKQTQHRNREIETLEPSEFYKSISKRENDHDKLRDGKYDGENYGRDASEFIGTDEDTDGRYLIEEPSDDIWLSFALEDRVDIAYHRCSDTHRREYEDDEKDVYFKSRSHRDMKKYLFVFVGFLYRIIDKLIYETLREYEDAESYEKWRYCRESRVVWKKILICERPDPSPEQDNRRSYKKCFYTLHPELCESVVVTKQSEMSDFLQSIEQAVIKSFSRMEFREKSTSKGCGFFDLASHPLFRIFELSLEGFYFCEEFLFFFCRHAFTLS